MVVQNLNTLRIHEMTQAQYDREYAAGNIEANSIYLITDSEIGGGGASTETIAYAQSDNLVAIPDGATEVTVSGTCSGYMSGGPVYFVLADNSRNIIASSHIGSGDDGNVLDVSATLEILDNAVYFGTYPFIDLNEPYDDSRNEGYSCNLSAEFNIVAKGKDGITPHIGANGNWYIGETDTGVKAEGKDGRGIKSVARTSGTGAAGTTDTYTITYTDNTTSTFTVYNGKDGADGKSIDRISYMASGTDSAGRVEHYYDVFVDDTPIGSFTVTDGKDGADGKDGTNGTNGTDGKSAYQYAQDGGYTGTEAAFTTKLAEQSASAQISAHNTSTSAHADIREQISQLSSEITNKQPSGDYALKSEIPLIPTSLKNPYALTFKLGSTTYTYDGSKAISITIEDGNGVTY